VCFDTSAASFYARLCKDGYDPESHIDVVPDHRLIYLCVPKSATTSIKMILSALAGRDATSIRELHKRKYSGLKSPTLVGLSVFHKLATDSRTFRFSFVRNPYARLVSAWADKFRDKSLSSCDSFVDQYLTHNWTIGSSKKSAGHTLSFARFVEFAAATAGQRIDAHWQLQDDLLDVPALKLDLIGKVENFDRDMAKVLDHVGADHHLRQAVGVHMNASRHEPWPKYYTRALADRVYRAYERDFDRFRYPRTIPVSQIEAVSQV